jgi:hypothetical protein
LSKELTFQIGKITTSATAGVWSTAFEFAPPSSSDRASRGVLFAVTSISASEKFDAALAGQQVVTALQESYYTQTTGGILPALERAVEAAHERLVTLVFSGEGGEEAVDFNLAVGVLWGSVFYLAQLGDARAVIYRGGELKLIGHRDGKATGDLSAPGKPDVRVASGLLEVGDKILLGTPRFFDLTPAAELGAIIGASTADGAVAKLADRVASEPAAAALALTLGLEGTPEPTKEALILAEPAPVSEAAEEVALSETESPQVSDSEPVPSGVEMIQEEEVVYPNEPEAPTEELSKQVSQDWHKYSRGMLHWAKRVRGLLMPALFSLKSTVQDSGLRPGLTKILRRAWEALGAPRTAMEGVAEARNRRTLLVLAGVLLFILILGAAFTSLTRGDSGKKDRFNQLISTAQAQYDEAQATATVNRAHAKDLLLSAEGELKEADALKIDQGKVNDLRSKVDGLLESVNQVFRVNPKTFYDLTSLSAGAAGIDLAGGTNMLYVLDPSGGLYQLDLGSKVGTVLSKDVALSKGQNLVLVGNFLYSYVPSQGIFGYDLKTSKFVQTSKADSAWGRLVDFASYSGNVYALDGGNNQIWRYTPISAAQFGPSTQWVKEDTNLQNATGIGVDGFVWVSQGNDLWRFSGGKRDSFLVQEVSPALSNIKEIYATPDTKNVYILEAGRVVVVGKDGTYQAQYLSDKFQRASSLVVDEAGSKAYILAEKEIVLLELR